MTLLKKVLDNTPKSVYNIFKDGGGFNLSSISEETSLDTTLYPYYMLVKKVYEHNPDLFPTPPVFAGGFFRDILWDNRWPSDLDLFFNSYGMTKEEAEDNLCLFLSQMGLSYTEMDNAAYARLGSMRVFNCESMIHARCHLQVILKDMGPPSDDPLYVTNDFHYNHGRAALSVVGEPEIHYHGHAVAGKEHKLHVEYREGGLTKCYQKLGRNGFKDISLIGGGYKVTKPKSGIKMPKGTNWYVDLETAPAYNTQPQVRQWDNQIFEAYVRRLYVNPPPQPEALQIQANEVIVAPPPLNLLEAQRIINQQRNEFVNQFDPLRNNRRPMR